MTKLTLVIAVFFNLFYSCSSSDNTIEVVGEKLDFVWTVPKSSVTGSFNLFPLAKNPVLTKASEVNFISEVSQVAIVAIKNEIHVYPYKFISPYECVNDVINGQSITLAYCPITQSAIGWKTNFKGETLILRSSGYLHHDNLIAYDEKSDSYWSQMLSKSIKGKYANDVLPTFNVIETTWGMVRQYFPDAMVFTNSSVTSKASNLIDFEDGNNLFGILDRSLKDNSKIHIYEYTQFHCGVNLYDKIIDSKKVIIVGNEERHFITSFINDSNTTFAPIQNNFPIVMEDSDGNQWNLFGVAVSGPRQGDQLKSPLSYVALGWAWRAFFSDFALNE
ncbi:DUF3179 domain-containing (seleno)protein [Flavobacteriaceae bacterium LMO-SS05]